VLRYFEVFGRFLSYERAVDNVPPKTTRRKCG
jgi:hypothetical protein